MNKHSIQAILTNACNWNCSYCSRRPKFTNLKYDHILESIEYIFKYHKHHLKHFNLSGGEPGLMSDSFWKEVIKLINKYDMKDQVDLYTNGLMFKHKYIIDELIDSIHLVKWHSIESFENNSELMPVILDHKDKIQQLVVYKNADSLKFIKWLNANKETILDNFLIVFDTNYVMSSDSINKVDKVIKTFNSKFNKNIVLKKDIPFNINTENRIKCMKRYTTIRIDYVKNIITPCCKITDSNLEINEFNLNQIMSNQICVYSPRCFKCKNLMM